MKKTTKLLPLLIVPFALTSCGQVAKYADNLENYVFERERPNLELIVKDIDTSLDRPNRLRRSYLWSKKIRLAVYKIITYVPRLISGNYKKKITNNDQ